MRGNSLNSSFSIFRAIKRFNINKRLLRPPFSLPLLIYIIFPILLKLRLELIYFLKNKFSLKAFRNHSVIVTKHMGEIQIVFDRFIFPHFYFFHSWELELVEFMSDYSQNSPYKKTTFVDIGAHVGLISKQIQIRNPDFNFILVEPNISNFDLLRTNITENVIYINRVVSNIDQKEIKLFIDRSNSGNSSTNFISTEFYNVKSIRLNDIFENLIKSSDANVILKLDCEGSDMELFNSLSSDNRLKLTAAVIEIVKTEQIIIDKFIPLLSEFNHFYFSQPNILRKRNRITKIDLSHLKHFLESLKVGEEINLFFTR